MSRDQVFRLRLTAAQRAELDRRAQAAGFRSASAWVLATLLSDANSPDGQPFRQPKERAMNHEALNAALDEAEREGNIHPEGSAEALDLRDLQAARASGDLGHAVRCARAITQDPGDRIAAADEAGVQWWPPVRS